MKWRYVLVNATIPDGSFYTIQREDYSVFPYFKDIQKNFKIVTGFTKFKLGKIGDAYSKWQYEPLPPFLTQELCKNPIP